jgi:hypothetical protein
LNSTHLHKTEHIDDFACTSRGHLNLSFIVAMWKSYLGLVINDNIGGLGLHLV